MMKYGADSKVKKTLVRNCEQKIKATTHKNVVRDVNATPCFVPEYSGSSKENELNQPSLCSSEALANYLSDVKKSVPPPLSAEDLNAENAKCSSKMTKKLNFHFNDRIYRNLVELNATIEDLKTRKDKRPSSSSVATKKDLEPDIEDFCDNEIERESPPQIPLIKPTFKTLKKVEDGQLHALVASFEIL